MTRLLRQRPSPAMAVALISLFVSLGGVGYAAATIGSAQIKNNSVRTQDIRNGTIRGKDVRRNSLAARQIKDPERFHDIGQRGQPAFQNGAVNYVPKNGNGQPQDLYSRAGFMKDNDGFVHLKGTVTITTTQSESTKVIFTLPRRYRPRRILDIGTIAEGRPGFVYVHPSGAVEAGGFIGTGEIGLDSITFRAGA
jgi:hypothetical protein